MAVQKPRIIAPVQPERWGSHFGSRGWNTFRDKINSGYPLYAQPATGQASWQKIIDYGTTILASLIKLTFVRRDAHGSVALKIKLAYSPDASAWTEEEDVQQIYGTNFRYVRVIFEFGGQIAGTPVGLLFAILTPGSGTANDKDVVSLEEVRVRLDVKEIDDGGIAQANASDVSGTHVNFNKDFVDIRNLTVTPIGRDGSNLPYQSAYVFSDVPNPTGFDVFIWDSAGVRATANFSWHAKGV